MQTRRKGQCNQASQREQTRGDGPNEAKTSTCCIKNLSVRRSGIPNAGMGLFAKADIEAGTVIGE